MALQPTSESGERTVSVREVRPVVSRSGNTRYVLTDDRGERYTTFREEIGDRARSFVGKPAKITFHKTQRGEFENVYLDAIEETDEDANDDEHDDDDDRAGRRSLDDIEEIAWKTAVDAAPWLLGGEPKTAVPPEELFEKLKPLKDLVADDLLKSRANTGAPDHGENSERQDEGVRSVEGRAALEDRAGDPPGERQAGGREEEEPASFPPAPPGRRRASSP